LLRRKLHGFKIISFKRSPHQIEKLNESILSKLAATWQRIVLARVTGQRACAIAINATPTLQLALLPLTVEASLLGLKLTLLS
jgi:hypothetical protein